ncbi:flagellar biosynthesis GTPase FlhF [Pseudoxanthomonas winnipegensis]|uniref:Flagellar biosynthesis GTPase FlhF n=1 Tax=Pseudoxanthomonas winnipegensis TaxID=2480810 RepID=A0AAW8GD89_9GAMM|nr:hypothetical protein [Pseudoxanthomonas winnipegensis]MDQ1120324.1 flagellar biosynthesis GTPase FlhF [Pseudoxanthomonas winnipegensis]
MNRSLSRGLLLALALGLALPALAADDEVVAQLNARLNALDANPDLREQGAYERLQAVQAIARYADSKRSERDALLYVAQRRVEIAEVAAQNGAIGRQIDTLDRTRNDLLLEASRRETARARQEAERLRVQQQIQAEEAERLRQQAEAEAAAQAEQVQEVISTATSTQQAKLNAARQKDAALARQEAELVSGAKLPKSSFGADGAETFVLTPAMFQDGQGHADRGRQVRGAGACGLHGRHQGHQAAGGGLRRQTVGCRPLGGPADRADFRRRGQGPGHRRRRQGRQQDAGGRGHRGTVIFIKNQSFI